MVNVVECPTVILVPRPFPPPVLIACSVRIWRGNAWEILSHAVVLGRQMVHTWWVVLDCNISCFTSTHPWCRKQHFLLPCKISKFQPLTDLTRKVFKLLHWVLPLVCLPSLYPTLPHVTRSPRSSTPYLYILQVAKCWRWEWSENQANLQWYRPYIYDVIV